MPLLYRVVDRRYPGSRSILTVGEKNAWLRSCDAFFALKDARGLSDERALHYRAAMHRTRRFNRTRFSAAYDEHVAGVQKYFAGREDLFFLDVQAHDAWTTLVRVVGAHVDPR